MDQPVSEPRHLDQRTGKFRIKNALFLQDSEGIGIIFGCPKAVLGNNMIAQVHRSLDGHDEIVFRASHLVWIGSEFGLRNLAQVFQSLKGGKYFGGDFSDLVGIIFQNPVPP